MSGEKKHTESESHCLLERTLYSVVCPVFLFEGGLD